MSAVIEVHNVVKSYPASGGRDRVVAVDGISFTVSRGEVVGLLGPNGAGKTTTVKVICGLVRPDHGRITVNGRDVQQERQQALRHISAVLEGNRNLYWRLTARENLEYFAGNRGRSRRQVRRQVGELLSRFQLSSKSGEPVNRLSRGMQQKLALTVAMLAETEVLLLDEPTLGLDVQTFYEVLDILRELASEGRTLVISTHDMAVVRHICDRVVIIDNGRIVADDSVTRLLDRFDTQTYLITLLAPLSDEQESRIRAQFPLCRRVESQQNPAIRVCIKRGDEIYHLLELLRYENAVIKVIDRETVAFEQVFLELIHGRSSVVPPERRRHGAPRMTYGLA